MAALPVSVVIPTHNRCARLLRVLDALAAQTLPSDAFEVIVVIDAGTDDTESALDARTWPFPLRHLRAEGRGASAARNTGARLARGERIVFLDDDIEVAPGFLRAHLDAAAKGAAVIGRSVAAGLPAGWFAASVRLWWTLRFNDMAMPGYRFGYSDVMSGNMSLPRAAFERIGGFDETLPCREDYELGYRLVSADVPICYAAAAEGRHFDASTPRRNLSRAEVEGRSDLRIARKHPALFRWMKCANMTAPTPGAAVLRMLVFRMPRLTRRMLPLALGLQSLLETLALRRSWDWLNGVTRALAYQLGVAAEAGSPQVLAALRADPPNIGAAALDLDLADGADRLRAAIAAARPAALTLRYEGRLVDEWRAEPGRERLEQRHLDARLAARLPDWALRDEARALLPPLPAEPPGWVSGARVVDGTAGMAELDLAGWTLRPLDTAPVFPLRVLVRRGRVPLGWLRVAAPDAAGAFWQDIRAAVLADAALLARLIRAARAPVAAADRPPISVVVCTRDRTETLARCLDALRQQDYPDYEIVVVDNAPSTDATCDLVAGLPGLRYVREGRPGLDWARNRGAAEARHGIVAYTDDDTCADRHWLTGLAEGFADPAVGFVTGLVAPMKLDTAARVYFEDVYGGMGKGFDAMMRYPRLLWPHDLLWASSLGVGANMAFRKAVFAAAGPFDPALDVGTATRGGGDIEMFHRALAKGSAHLYQPSAFVWHEHRADFDGLARQLADNGSGFASYLFAVWHNRTVPRLAVIRFAGRAWVADWFLRRLIRPGRHRRSLVLAEIRGVSRAPKVWRQARRRAAELAAPAAVGA